MPSKAGHHLPRVGASEPVGEFGEGSAGTWVFVLSPSNEAGTKMSRVVPGPCAAWEEDGPGELVM